MYARSRSALNLQGQSGGHAAASRLHSNRHSCKTITSDKTTHLQVIALLFLQTHDGEKQHYIRHLFALLRQLVQSRPLSSRCRDAGRPKQLQVPEATCNTHVHVDRGTGARGAIQGGIGNAAVGVRAANPLRLAAKHQSRREYQQTAAAHAHSRETASRS